MVAGLVALTGCENLLTRPIIYGTVRVEAVSRLGVPLPGITVELFTSFRPMGYTTTDANGRASFKRVPRAQYGIVMHLPADYADLSELMPVPNGTIVAGINVDAGTDTTINFVFARRGFGALEAEVVDSGDASPLSGITVTFYSQNGPLGQRLTDAAGIARLDSVPFGQYGAYVIPVNPADGSALPAIFLDGLVVDREIVPRPLFEIPSCRAAISVEVRDLDSLVVVGHPIRLYTGEGIRQVVNTDASGAVDFADIPCGQYGVAAVENDAFDWVGGTGYVDGIDLSDGDGVAVQLRVRRK